MLLLFLELSPVTELRVRCEPGRLFDPSVFVMRVIVWPGYRVDGACCRCRRGLRLSRVRVAPRGRLWGRGQLGGFGEPAGYPLGELGLAVDVATRPLPGGVVDLDVDEDHDAAGDVEGPEGAVHHVADVLAQLEGRKRSLVSA